MPIQVTCSKCLKRFNVGDVHAGKTGACPNCKNPIKIPDRSDEVVIHAPESFGPKDASGRAVLKPIQRKEMKVTAPVVVGIVGGVIVTFAVAFLIGRVAGDSGPPAWLMGLGACLLAPPVVYAGYGFLRNDELGAFAGTELWVRVAACAAGYAALWGGYAAVGIFLLGARPPEMYHLAFLIPTFSAIGGGMGLAALELDFTNGCLHYGLYVLVSVLLRLTMGLSPI